jgi:hypothetical protein
MARVLAQHSTGNVAALHPRPTPSPAQYVLKWPYTCRSRRRKTSGGLFASKKVLRAEESCQPGRDLLPAYRAALRDRPGRAGGSATCRCGGAELPHSGADRRQPGRWSVARAVGGARWTYRAADAARAGLRDRRARGRAEPHLPRRARRRVLSPNRRQCCGLVML